MPEDEAKASWGNGLGRQRRRRQEEELQLSPKGEKDSKDFDSHDLSMVEPIDEMGDRRWDGSSEVVDHDDDEGGGCRVSALREDQTSQTPELFPRPSFLGPQTSSVFGARILLDKGVISDAGA